MPSETDALVAFLREQLDTDERVARGAHPGPWAAQRGGLSYVVTDYPGTLPGKMDFEIGRPDLIARLAATMGRAESEYANADHIALHDPARVLREVAAKRRIVDWVECELADDAEQRMLQEIARWLALPYNDRPGYLPEWAAEE
jgi:Family of unknown function (DUF6221)